MCLACIRSVLFYLVISFFCVFQEAPHHHECLSLFFFRFSESNARAREWRSRETRETRAQHARGRLRVSRFARQTTGKRETPRSLMRKLIEPFMQTTNVRLLSDTLPSASQWAEQSRPRFSWWITAWVNHISTRKRTHGRVTFLNHHTEKTRSSYRNGIW